MVALREKISKLKDDTEEFVSHSGKRCKSVRLFIHSLLMDVLVHLGCYHSISKQVAYKKETFIAHIPGGWNSKMTVDGQILVKAVF